MSRASLPIGRDHTARKGVVLPMVLIILAVLSAAVAGAFSYVSAEGRIADARQGEQDALLVAQAGMAMFMAAPPTTMTDSMAPTSGSARVAPDSSVTTRLTLDVSDVRLRRMSGGTRVPDTAEVKAFLWRRGTTATDSSLWLIRVRGIVARATNARMPAIERTITMTAWFVPTGTGGSSGSGTGGLTVLSAWVSLSGASRNGGAGTYSGADACGQDTDRFAFVVAKNAGAGWSGSSNGLSVKGVDSTRTISTLSAALNLPWTTASGLTGVTPDLIVDPAGGTTGLPSTACARMSSDTGYAPTILVNNTGGSSYALGSLCGNGVRIRGRVMITGSATSNGGSGGPYEGVFLIGESFTFNGNNSISGAVVSGLRATSDAGWATSAILAANRATFNGNKTVTYNSCAVSRAMRGVSGSAGASATTGLKAVRNTYSDQWSAF